MCEVNWLLFLEYLKVILSWPPMAVLISVLVIFRFRGAIDDFLKRLVEGNILGQAFKAVPPRDQQLEVQVGKGTDALAKAAEAAALTAGPPTAQPLAPLPPELANDPLAPRAIAYVQNNPVQTVIEYKRLLFNYNSERLFNLIYGTQIALLVFLASRPDEGANLAQLSQFHEAHQAQAQRTEYQLRDYVHFLASFGVIGISGTPEEQNYRITQNGVEFLSYIKAQYPSVWNQRAF